MEIAELFKAVSLRLAEEEGLSFALCGGMVANLYRDELRLTADIDFLISAGGGEAEFAQALIEGFGLSAHPKRISELSRVVMMGKKSTPYVVVIGRHRLEKTAPGLDFLLPAFPWAEPALKRAQSNQLQYDFGKVPALTVEDVLIAKLYAVSHSARYKDLDDLESIFRTAPALDLQYLCAELDRLKLSLPRELESQAPKALQVASKRNRSKKK